MIWRCHGCVGRLPGSKVQGLSSQTDCRRDRKLCKRFDATIVEHRPWQTIDEYCEISQHLAADYTAAVRRTETTPIPESPEAFERLLLDLHRDVFQRSLPAIAGVLRQKPVFFGCHPHAFEGCPSGETQPRLHALFNLCVAPGTDFTTISKSDFVKRVAVFLEAFFMIHPFADGNGRVARLFASVLCHASKRWSFRAIREDKGNHRQRRKYVRALNSAHHAVAQDRPVSLSLARRPYKYLEAWVEGRLAEIIRDSELIETPP
jgi:fido (protein-threonine AMPylation protein)